MSATKEPPKLPDSSLGPPLIWAMTLVVMLYVMFTYGLLRFLGIPGTQIEGVSQTGQFGDSYGALNALFTGLAFAALIVTLVLQRRELQASLQELRHSVVAQQELAESSKTEAELSKQQVDALGKQLQGSVHDRLYKQNVALLTVLTENADLRQYFYDKAELAAATQEDRNRILLIAEMFAGFLEVIALHLEELPGSENQPGTIRHVWRTFIIEAYQLSPAIRQCFRDHGSWYATKLHDILRSTYVPPTPGGAQP